MTEIIQCAPNFSEGRRHDVINAIVAAADCVDGARLIDWSADPDHNRMVLTLVGAREPVCAAVTAAAAVAVDRIDISSHDGVHPRLGAIDVIPLVPISGIDMPHCAGVATELGGRLAGRFNLPIFLYERSTRPARLLPDVRRNAFKTLAPDFGPAEPHPTAGACVVGARGPLIAFNINLATADPEPAKTIARELRDDGGSGFRGVRALGLSLASRGLTQVSMNIVRPQSVSMHGVVAYVARRGIEMGTHVAGGEVIGALPGFAAFHVVADALICLDLRPTQVLLENWPMSGQDHE